MNYVVSVFKMMNCFADILLSLIFQYILVLIANKKVFIVRIIDILSWLIVDPSKYNINGLPPMFIWESRIDISAHHYSSLFCVLCFYDAHDHFAETLYELIHLPHSYHTVVLCSHGYY